MDHSFTVTDEQLVKNLPVIADWPPERRASLAAGLSQLTGQMVHTSNPAELVGVVLVSAMEGGMGVLLGREKACARARELGVHEDTVAELESENAPGYLSVLALVLGTGIELVFACPMMAIRVAAPSSAKH